MVKRHEKVRYLPRNLWTRKRFSVRIFVTLATPNLLSFGRTKMKNYVFLFALLSLIRNFAADR